MSITPSHIIEYLYCPRFTYFEYVLGIPQYEERHYKVEKGRNIHDSKLKQNKEYVRKRIGAIKKHTDQYLVNELLRGQVDEILELDDGIMAPLDYKFAVYKDKIYETYKTQVICYSILIEDNFNKKVNKGFLVYTRSRNYLVELPVTTADKHSIRKIAGEIITIIDDNTFPKATKYKKRCLHCTYRNICIK